VKKDVVIKSLAFLSVLVAAMAIRLPTFKLPHDNGDQVYYLGLAMKLDKSGFDGYTLRNIDAQGSKGVLGVYPSTGEKGSLLTGIIRTGLKYYDEPLFHRPYGFPYALMISHRIFAPDKPYLALFAGKRTPEGKAVVENVDKNWPLQFYAAFVPFLFSILFIICTYILAARMFDFKVALIAMSLMAIAPIEILSSQKVWADTMIAFFVLLTVLLYYIARERKSIPLAFFAGVCSGIAVLVKQTGGMVIIAIVIFHFWEKRADLLKPRGYYKALFDKQLISMAFGFVIITFHWFFLAYTTYGNILYKPPRDSSIFQHVGWFVTLSRRPRLLYLVTIPYLVPVFALAYAALASIIPIKGYSTKERRFLAVWLLTFLVILIYLSTKENRYMLPAYPAIAILSADILSRIGAHLNRRHAGAGDVLVIMVLLACAFWSVPIGLKHAYYNVALIMKPF